MKNGLRRGEERGEDATITKKKRENVLPDVRCLREAVGKNGILP